MNCGGSAADALKTRIGTATTELERSRQIGNQTLTAGTPGKVPEIDPCRSGNSHLGLLYTVSAACMFRGGRKW
jgi:hypothetical protein